MEVKTRNLALILCSISWTRYHLKSIDYWWRRANDIIRRSWFNTYVFPHDWFTFGNFLFESSHTWGGMLSDRLASGIYQTTEPTSDTMLSFMDKITPKNIWQKVEKAQCILGGSRVDISIEQSMILPYSAQNHVKPTCYNFILIECLTCFIRKGNFYYERLTPDSNYVLQKTHACNL